MGYLDVAPIVAGVGIGQPAVDTYFDNLATPPTPPDPPEITFAKVTDLADIYFEDGVPGRGITERGGLLHVSRELDLSVAQIKSIIIEFEILQGLWASVPVFRYSFGDTITVNVDQSVSVSVNKDNDITSYAISPSLPTGLTFSTTTGAFGGAATVTSSFTEYTITATNDNGTADYVFTLRVV